MQFHEKGLKTNIMVSIVEIIHSIEGKKKIKNTTFQLRARNFTTRFVRPSVGWLVHPLVCSLVRPFVKLFFLAFTRLYCSTASAQMHSQPFLLLPLPTSTQLGQPCIRRYYREVGKMNGGLRNYIELSIIQDQSQHSSSICLDLA